MSERSGFIVTGLDDARVGRIAEQEAMILFLRSGWEVFESVSPASKSDFIILNPQTQEKFTVQVKTANLVGKGSIKTYTTGTGRDKGEKRQKISYYKTGIDYIIAIDVKTSYYWLYESEYFKTYESLSVKKHPGIPIPIITETEATRNKKNSKNKKHATLELLYD